MVHMKRILLFSCLWKRPKITKIHFESITRLKREGYEFIPFVVLSENEMIPLCEEYGIKYVWAENRPVGTKHNTGIKESLKIEWDYLMVLGSDDIISSSLFDHYEPLMGKDFFGVRDIHFFDYRTGRFGYYRQDHGHVGAGRMHSRRMIETILNKGCFYPAINKGLDNASEKIAKENGFNIETVVTIGPCVIDIKSDVNLWKFNSFPTKPRNIKDLKGYPEEVIKLLLTDKTITTMKNYKFVHLKMQRAVMSVSTFDGEKKVNNVIDFKPQGFSGEGSAKGAYFTSNEGIKSKLEDHPLYGIEFVLEDEIEDSPVNKDWEEITEVEGKEIKSIAQAASYISKRFDVEFAEVRGKENLEKAMRKYKISFPNLFKNFTKK